MPFQVNGKLVETYFDFIDDSISKVHGTTLQNKKVLEISRLETYDLEPLITKGMVHTLLEPYYTDENESLTNPVMRMPNPGDVYVPKALHSSSSISDLVDTFDVIINISSLEHIMPLDSQYDIWKNLHSMCKVGGVMIHAMPDTDECLRYLRWFGHCHLYFSSNFFENLASKMGYEIINNELINFNRSVALKKVTNGPFNLNKDEFLTTIDLMK